MSLVAIGGGKGAGGVTTTATVLAAVWPTVPVLADCDPAGGDLAWRLRAADGGWLRRDGGVVGLAAAARTGTAPLDVTAQAQVAVGGLPVLVGVESPAQATTIGPLWHAIADALARTASDVIADCGRLGVGLPSMAVVERADLVMLVARATPESVDHLRHAVGSVAGARRLHVAVLAEPARLDDAPGEIRAALAGRAVAGVHALALDPAAAAALAGVPTRHLDRSRLVATARQVAAGLHAATSQSANDQVETALPAAAAGAR